MTEQRLIDANAVEAEIRKLAEKHFANGDIEFSNGVMKSVTRVKSAPTIDAAIVVHARWVDRKEPDEFDNVLRECSNCQKGDTQAKDLRVPHCWNCGAKMDKEATT